MDEHQLRRIVREEVRSGLDAGLEAVRSEIGAVRGEVGAVRDEVLSTLRSEVGSVRDEVKAVEQRLAENGRLQFRQLADLYRSPLETRHEQ